MLKEISGWINALAKAKNKEEIEKIVTGFELSNYIKDNEDILDKVYIIIYHKIPEIPLDNIPYILDSLYQSDDFDKFTLFCHLLEKTYKDLPFLTHLENYPIHEVKFKTLLPTLLRVSDEMGGVANCMWLILLKFIDNDELINEDIKEIINNITEQQLSIVVDYLENNKYEINDSMAYFLSILLDVSGYFPNEKSASCAEKIIKVKNNNVKLFAAFSLFKNDKVADNSDLEEVAADLGNAEKLLRLLERIDQTKYYPVKYAKQEWIARSNLCNWLTHPSELGGLPDEIELLGTLDKDGFVNYLYKFKSNINDFYSKKGWMFGLSGGYEKDSFSSNSTGWTFSGFDPVSEDFFKQADSQIEMIKNYWKQRAEQMENQELGVEG